MGTTGMISTLLIVLLGCTASRIDGFKGEPGVVDNAEVDRLRDRVAALELELRKTISALHSGHANLSDGWITPYNGYQYKRTASHANWQSSRSMCQAMGADLAVHGMQDSRVRLRIVNAFPSSVQWMWIGLTDVEEEGRWMWIDGSPLTDELAANLWRSGEPNNAGSGEDCAIVQDKSLVYDDRCSMDGYYAICEKDWSP